MRRRMYAVVFTRKAAKQIEALDAGVRKEVARIIEEEIAHDPRCGKPLQGPLKGMFSRRVGRLRIVYRAQKQELIIFVIAVEHRKSVYKQR